MLLKYSALLICLSLVACERSQTNKIQNTSDSGEAPINSSTAVKPEIKRNVDILTFNQQGFADILVGDAYTDKHFKEIEDSRIEDCFYAKSLKYPKLEIDFQIIDQKVAVISTRNSDYKVDNGLKIGDPEQKIYQIYGNRKFEKELNPYGDFKNQYSIFYWKDKTKTLGIRYDIDHHKITEIYVGNQNLELMEGCA